MYNFGPPLFVGETIATGPAEAVVASTGGASLAPLALFIGIVLIHKFMTQGEMGETIEQETLVEEK